MFQEVEQPPQNTRSSLYIAYATTLGAVLVSSIAALLWRQIILAIGIQVLLLVGIFGTASYVLRPTEAKILRVPAIFALVVLCSSFLFHVGPFQGIFEPKLEHSTHLDTAVSLVRFFIATYLSCCSLFFILVICTGDEWSLAVVEALAQRKVSSRVLCFIFASLCIVALSVVPTMLVYLSFAPSPFLALIVLGFKLGVHALLASLPYFQRYPHPCNLLQLIMVLPLFWSIAQPHQDVHEGITDWVHTGYVLQHPAGYSVYVSLAISLLWRQPILAIGIQAVLLVGIFATTQYVLRPTEVKILRTPAILALAVLCSSWLFHAGAFQGIFEPKQEHSTDLDTVVGLVRFFVAMYLSCFSLFWIVVICLGLDASGLGKEWALAVVDSLFRVSSRALCSIIVSLCIVALAVVPTLVIYLFFTPSPTYTLLVLGFKFAAYILLAVLPHSAYDASSGHLVRVFGILMSLFWSISQLDKEVLGGVSDYIDTGYVLQHPAGYLAYVGTAVCDFAASLLAASSWFLPPHRRTPSVALL
ncbi:hypothetical protein MKEN_00891700 [Mycena kentingensis (nom. inval.)]|nr:hypothetical protein MKEN_00891700 [Mycena kentingensis (nom. inval.)]